MERILRYLCEQETDSTGEAWTLVSRITADLAITREEVYTELMKAEDEGLIKVIKTLEPGPYGLVSVAITRAQYSDKFFIINSQLRFMSSKEDLLNSLSVKQLKELAKENKVLLVREDPWSFSSKKNPAKNKGEIIEILNDSRKVSKKEVEAKVFGTQKKKIYT